MTRVPKPAERFVQSCPAGLGVAEVIDHASESALARTDDMTDEMLTLRAAVCPATPDDAPPPGPGAPGGGASSQTVG